MISRKAWAKPAIRVAAAGLGAAAGGPLGGALGAWVGASVGGTASALIETYAEKFGDKAGEALLEAGGDSLAEWIKGDGLDLGDLYRATLQVSLEAIRSKAVEDYYEDWFKNWKTCLKKEVTLDLPPLRGEQLVPEKLEALLRSTLERLDGQGAAIRSKSQSVILKCRVMPEDLFLQLKTSLPDLLNQTFRGLIVNPEYEVAWKQAEDLFRNAISGQIKTSVTRRLVTVKNWTRSLKRFEELLRKRNGSALRRRGHLRRRRPRITGSKGTLSWRRLILRCRTCLRTAT